VNCVFWEYDLDMGVGRSVPFAKRRGVDGVRVQGSASWGLKLTWLILQLRKPGNVIINLMLLQVIISEVRKIQQEEQ
jgi:hypothetical protein